MILKMSKGQKTCKVGQFGKKKTKKIEKNLYHYEETETIFLRISCFPIFDIECKIYAKNIQGNNRKEDLTLIENNRDLRKNIQKIPVPLEITLNPLFNDISFAKNRDCTQNLHLIP
jgi:hypothetical protein